MWRTPFPLKTDTGLTSCIPKLGFHQICLAAGYQEPLKVYRLLLLINNGGVGEIPNMRKTKGRYLEWNSVLPRDLHPQYCLNTKCVGKLITVSTLFLTCTIKD